MFDGFQLDRVDVGEVTLRVRYGGEGEPVVLLHGHPRTHTTWHHVAPQLAESFFVVCPDLRGYGQSTLQVGDALLSGGTRGEQRREHLEPLVGDRGLLIEPEQASGEPGVPAAGDDPVPGRAARPPRAA